MWAVFYFVYFFIHLGFIEKITEKAVLFKIRRKTTFNSKLRICVKTKDNTT